ncbi:MAG: cell division protein FtsQ [Phycisphaeraceae bacterium]|nr:cell division protein FtsQ [Phycisphaeraceae bacterium]
MERLRRLRIAGIAAAWVAALVGGATVIVATVPSLVARADLARSSDGIRVNFVNAPVWMTPADLAPLEELVREQLSGSPFDQDGLRVAADALFATGWIETLSQVRRSALGAVEVRATWAEPAALVRDDDGDHLIDSRGRLLPRSYLPAAAPAFPRITGVRAPRPVAPGERYGGGEVTAALALLRVLDERPFRAQIASVDTSRYRDDGSLTLRTTRDAKLRWGRAPGEGSAAEVPTHQKLSYLQFLYDHYGRIDAVGDGELNLTGDFVGMRR